MTQANEAHHLNILKKHESPIHSSVHGDMTELLQLCQNDTTKEYFYTYEVLDAKGGIIGGRLHYAFEQPDDALAQWDNFTNNGEIDSGIGVSITKELFPVSKKPKL